MSAYQPSRRSLFGGMLTGLFGWVGMACARTSPLAREPREPRPEGMTGRAWIYTYDGDGRLIAEREASPADALRFGPYSVDPPVRSVIDPSGLVTTYTYSR